MLNNNINVSFSFTDEFGNTTSVGYDVERDYIYDDELDNLNYLYVKFLIACGFTYAEGKEVQLIEE